MKLAIPNVVQADDGNGFLILRCLGLHRDARPGSGTDPLRHMDTINRLLSGEKSETILA